MNRVIILLCIFVGLWCFPFVAHAQDTSQCHNLDNYGSGSQPYCATRSEAYNVVVQLSDKARSSGYSIIQPPCPAYSSAPAGVNYKGVYICYANTGLTVITIARRFIGDGCAPPSTWSDTTHSCACPSGSILGLNGQCQTCESLNDEAGSPAQQGFMSRPFSSRCTGGCMLAVDSGGGCTIVDGNKLCWGTFRYTGESCAMQPTDPQEPEKFNDQNPPPKESCQPAGSGQTMCIESNGDHCYVSGSGKKTCWKPGETGQKGNDNGMQRREPGTQATPPSPPQTANGDPYVQNGTPITSTTTKGDTTITTTTTNYNTQNGTNADNQQPGTNPDGTPVGDDKDETSASGGGDCQTAPVVSGDAALNMVATQAWATRCAVESGNAAKVTGDVGDCSAPFAVEGDNANAVKLRALRATICGDNQPGWTKGDAPPLGEDTSDDDIASHTRFGLSMSASNLDTSDMVGGGTCPNFTITIYGNTISTSEFEYWCKALAILRGLILLFAAYLAIRILMGSND